MKHNLLYNFILFFVGLLLGAQALAAVPVTAFPYERTKEITYRYAIGSGTQLYVTNSYGNVSIKPWDKDSIMVVVRIVARAKSPIDSERLLDYATIDEYSGPSLIVLKTVFGKNATIFERSKLGFQEAVGDREVGVEYSIYAPNEVHAILENRFGDILLPDWKGNLGVNLSYGDLRAASCKGKLNLKLKYGKAYLNSLEAFTVDGTYAEIKAERVAQLTTVGLSNKFNIGKCGSAEIKAKNDKYYFESLESIYGTTFLSVVNVEWLGAKVNLSCKYGEVAFTKISPKATKVSLKGNGTDFTLGFDEDATVNADLILKSEKYTNYAPQFRVVKDERVEKTHFLTVRKGNDVNTQVTIDAISAYINLKVL